jgi:hypothetical protein
LQWRAAVDKEELYTEGQCLRLNMTDASIAKVAVWLEAVEEGRPKYELIRTTVAAFHSPLTTEDGPTTSLDLESYTVMLVELAEW